MQPISVTSENFHSEVLSSDQPVLLDFWASWCGPCRMVLPILDQIARDRTDIKVCKVNVDEQSELASQYGIMSIPTLMVVKNGQVAARVTGARLRADIEALVDNA